MTRDQIKDKIIDIIHSCTYAGEFGDNEILGIDNAAEDIMELWDQGFTYELDKSKNS